MYMDDVIEILLCHFQTPDVLKSSKVVKVLGDSKKQVRDIDS